MTERPVIIFGTPGLVRMRGLRAGFPGSTTCPYWCFEVKIQDVADSNCDLGGENEAGTPTPWETTPQTISYMAWQPGMHYINQDLSVRLCAHSRGQLARRAAIGWWNAVTLQPRRVR
jgi:hypothetical protein